jgi:hydroxypyruvate isomerase
MAFRQLQETSMTRFAANLSMLFTEVPLLNRFERAARAGFSCVEIQFPYEATRPGSARPAAAPTA